MQTAFALQVLIHVLSSQYALSIWLINKTDSHATASELFL